MDLITGWLTFLGNLAYLIFIDFKIIILILIPIVLVILAYLRIVRYILETKENEINPRFIRTYDYIFNSFSRDTKRGRFIILILAFLILLSSTIPISKFYVDQTTSEDEIRNFALNLAGRETNPVTDAEKKEAAIRINKKMRYKIINLNHYPYYFFPFKHLRFDKDEKWIYKTRYGRCGDYAELYTALLRSIDIPARRVFTPAEDHSWTEFSLNDTWYHSDPSAGRGESIERYVFDNPSAYDRWNLSKVYYYTENGSKKEITGRYTDTANLTVTVKNWTENGLSGILGRPKVSIKNLNPKAQGRISDKGEVNESGEFSTNLGVGRYRIIVKERRMFIFNRKAQTELRLYPNTDRVIKLIPKKALYW